MKRLPSADIGEKIKKARMAAGLTQKDIANTCGICRQYVLAVEQGKHDPSVAVARKLLNAVGLNLEVTHAE